MSRSDGAGQISSSGAEPLRQAFVDFLRTELIGPADGIRERVLEPPNRRYLMGTLFPAELRPGTEFEQGVIDEVGDVVADDHTTVDPTEDDASETEPAQASWTGGFLPVSMGLSFYTDADRLTVSAHAARYRIESVESKDENGKSVGVREWVREPLPDSEISVLETDSHPLFGGMAAVEVIRRPLGGGLRMHRNHYATGRCDLRPEMLLAPWAMVHATS